MSVLHVPEESLISFYLISSIISALFFVAAEYRASGLDIPTLTQPFPYCGTTRLFQTFPYCERYANILIAKYLWPSASIFSGCIPASGISGLKDMKHFILLEVLSGFL